MVQRNGGIQNDAQTADLEGGADSAVINGKFPTFFSRDLGAITRTSLLLLLSVRNLSDADTEQCRGQLICRGFCVNVELSVICVGVEVKGMDNLTKGWHDE